MNTDRKKVLDMQTSSPVMETFRGQRFGVRWQPAEAKRSEDWSVAATPLFARLPSSESGVALPLPAAVQKLRLGGSRVGCLSVSIRG